MPKAAKKKPTKDKEEHRCSLCKINPLIIFNTALVCIRCDLADRFPKWEIEKP